ncbi:MAG: restriction endonuclease subunit S [Thiohalocapsa sp.]|nr:restriction endonuclease subunit S [Thiohalocapsa sp.]
MIRAQHLESQVATRPLGEVVDFLDSRRKPVKASDRVEGDYAYYGANGKQGTINDFLFDEPLVLLAEDGGHFGDPYKAIAYVAEGKYWVNNHAHVLKPKDGLDLRFLFRVLERYDVTPFIKGATRAKLTKGDAENIPIPFLPLPEQKRIAAILDKADAIRRKRQQAIELADQFLRSVFLDLFGDPVTNPKQWDVLPIKKLGKVITGSTPSSQLEGMYGQEVPFVTPGDLDDNLTNVKRWLTPEGASQSRTCRSGSLMACCIGATIGKVAIASQPSAFNQQINVVEWNERVVDLYGYYLFKEFPVFITKNAIKTTLPILKKSLFENVQIPIPGKALQEKFASIVNQNQCLVRGHREFLAEPLFDSLSQRAFSGQL